MVDTTRKPRWGAARGRRSNEAGGHQGTTDRQQFDGRWLLIGVGRKLSSVGAEVVRLVLLDNAFYRVRSNRKIFPARIVMASSQSFLAQTTRVYIEVILVDIFWTRGR